MKLEDQLISVKFSKKLKNLGVNKDSYFHHCNFYLDDFSIFTPKKTKSDMDGPDDFYLLSSLQSQERSFYAYSVPELGAMLPVEVEDEGINYELRFFNINGIGYWNHHCGKLKICHSNSEANARAELIIYLIENGLVKAEDL